MSPSVLFGLLTLEYDDPQTLFFCTLVHLQILHNILSTSSIKQSMSYKLTGGVPLNERQSSGCLTDQQVYFQ